MEVSVTENGNVVVVALVGTIDSATVETVGNILTSQTQSGHNRVVADMGGVPFINSAGLRALLVTLKDARGKGGDLRLANIQPDVHRALELGGFLGMFQRFPDAGAAVASFSK